MFAVLTFDLPASTKTALLNNWLVNLTGEEGRFVEMDWMQERYNYWLEELAQYKGKEFGDTFYRFVLSMHVHHFLHLNSEFEEMVELAPRRHHHSEPHLKNELKELLGIFRDKKLHRLHKGRDFGHHMVDDFEVGLNRLKKGKLSDFIEESTRARELLERVTDTDTLQGVDPTTYLCKPIYYQEGRLYLPPREDVSL